MVGRRAHREPKAACCELSVALGDEFGPSRGGALLLQAIVVTISELIERRFRGQPNIDQGLDPVRAYEHGG